MGIFFFAAVVPVLSAARADETSPRLDNALTATAAVARLEVVRKLRRETVRGWGFIAIFCVNVGKTRQNEKRRRQNPSAPCGALTL
jgi:hypothetical protein